ncbi:MAG: pilin [Patescibacteria group bacterium]
MLQNLAQIIKNPLKADNIPELIENVADFAVAVGLPIATIFIVYSGFLFVSAKGNEKKLESAKETFKWAVVGAALIVGARFLAAAIVNFAKGL